MTRRNQRRGKGKKKHGHTSKYGNGWGFDSGPGVSAYGGSTYTPKVKKRDCVHWQNPVELAEGIIIHASGTRHMPKDGGKYPEIGLYFCSGWDNWSSKRTSDSTYTEKWGGPKEPDEVVKKAQPDSELAHLDWHDFSTPTSKDSALEHFEYILNKAGEGKFVEIGCIGSHGRTGTALAAMKIMLGEANADTAIAWARKVHCENAVESVSQEAWLWDVAEKLYGDEAKKQRPKATPVHNSWQKKQEPITVVETNDLDDIDEWLLEKAADDYDDLIVRGVGEAGALEQVMEWYTITAEEFEEYYKQLPKDDTPELTEFEQANNAVLQQQGETNGCLLCTKDYSDCDCMAEGWI